MTTQVHPSIKKLIRKWFGVYPCVVDSNGKLTLPDQIALRLNINVPLFVREGDDGCIEILESRYGGAQQVPIEKILTGEKPNQRWIYRIQIPEFFRLPTKSHPDYVGASFWFKNESGEASVIMEGEGFYLRLLPWPWPRKEEMLEYHCKRGDPQRRKSNQG